MRLTAFYLSISKSELTIKILGLDIVGVGVVRILIGALVPEFPNVTYIGRYIGT